MCTAQYSACLRDPREETHILYNIHQRQDQSQLKGLESSRRENKGTDLYESASQLTILKIVN